MQNPFPITEDGLNARYKSLYETFCGICHGNDGGGNGWIYENGAYPAAPRNFLGSRSLGGHVGQAMYYHAIMHGKNVMGAYKDKINYEERYQVIGYIRALQAEGARRRLLSGGQYASAPTKPWPGANAPSVRSVCLESC